MGATCRGRESLQIIGTMEQLSNWISQVRTKKMKFLRNRRRNIRVEAVLSYALSQAEQELRMKQIAKIKKWEQMKQQMVQQFPPNDENNCNNYNGTLLATSDSNPENIWTDAFYPELSSLDSFMTELSQVKVPLHR